MTGRGVVLCGPPGSGKNTVTHALGQADSRFVHVVDPTALGDVVGSGACPVVHATGLAELRRMLDTTDLEWTRVWLWADRPTCESRCRERGDVDVPERLRAWDTMLAELGGDEAAGLFHGMVYTEHAPPEVAVEAVRKLRSYSEPELMSKALIDECMALCSGSKSG